MNSISDTPVIQIAPQIESEDSSLAADTEDADLDLREWEWIKKDMIPK